MSSLVSMLAFMCCQWGNWRFKVYQLTVLYSWLFLFSGILSVETGILEEGEC